MHPELKTVIELQQLDQRIAELTAQIESLPGEIRTLESQLNDFIHTHQDRQQRLSQSQKERRDLEGDIQVIQARISKHKDQLYEVKTNEQYRAMLKEIEGEEARIRQVEDQLLEKMIEAEQLDKLIHEAASRLEGEKARVAAETNRLRALCQADVDERDRMAAQRAEDVTALTPEVVELYERIRRGRRGMALAEVRDGSCMGCNVRLRPQVYNEVRANQAIITCESCGRILFYVEPPPGESAGAGDSHDATDQPVAPN